MRDAMSLLDQVIAWGGREARRRRGRARARRRERAACCTSSPRAVLDGDAAACLARASVELAEQGYDMAHVARGLLAELRDLVVAKVCREPGPLLDLADEEARDVMALAARATPTIWCACTTAFRARSTTSCVARSRAPRSR